MSPRRRRRRNFRSVRAVFWPLMSMRSEEMDKIGELPSLSEPERVVAPFSSPVTPAYIKMVRLRREESGLEVPDEIEEACMSFESYLMEMLVEERKVRDLMDVEELLSCWDNLKCPVFVELVCKFYGELCKDLFSGDEAHEVVDDTTVVYLFVSLVAVAERNVNGAII
ncbi:transcription repressor OFP17-like [Typha angustifolia]|uniref:transcription repressor OFP17-like n=1 Tax=Typha angustifolia TaxID=59011 RepID=UPI003C2F50A6